MLLVPGQGVMAFILLDTPLVPLILVVGSALLFLVTLYSCRWKRLPGSRAPCPKQAQVTQSLPQACKAPAFSPYTMHLVGEGAPKWLARRACDVAASGEALTDGSYSCQEPWWDAVVPGTALTTLVANGVLPCPDVGCNNIDSIPDIAAIGKAFYTLWYRTAFATPRGWAPTAGGRCELRFHGVNYSLRAYLNGAEVALAQPRGMFNPHNMDVTAQLMPAGCLNHLAVLVLPPDAVGDVSRGGQGGDHFIAQNVTAQYVAGWDWVQPVRDRNTGIWDAVDLRFMGPVALRNLRIVAGTDAARGIPLGQQALLQASVCLVGRGTAARPVRIHATVNLKGDKEREVAAWTERVTVAPGKTLHVLQTQALARPALWWPIHMGKQALHQLRLELYTEDDGKLSDMLDDTFGVREIRSEIDPVLGGHIFLVNGAKVFIRGGNWVASDWLLRLSPERYATEVRFHAEMGLNMVRLWGGAALARQPFYEACDAAGLLVWVEFWVTGDCNGRGATPASPVSNPAWPSDHTLFLASAAAAITCMRNHACVALWCGGNEQRPAPDLNAALRRLLPGRPLAPGQRAAPPVLGPGPELDAGRAYVPGSLWGGFGAGDGAFSDGPYGILDPAAYFAPCAAIPPWAFNPEVGSIGIPSALTIRELLPDPAQAMPPTLKELPNGLCQEVPNAAWAARCYLPYGRPDGPDPLPCQLLLYASATELKSLEAFCDVAQIVNYIQYRALLEGWASQMWTRYTGALVWKSQNPWGGFRGQLYDWTLTQTGGFWGVRCACEPLHVQLNLASLQVEVVNVRREAAMGLRIELRIFGVSAAPDRGRPATLRCANVDSSANCCTTVPLRLPDIGTAPTDGGPPDARFVFLRLIDARGALLSRNVYWLPGAGPGLRALRPWAQRCRARLQAEGVTIHRAGRRRTVSLRLVNASRENVAWWVRLSLHESGSGDGFSAHKQAARLIRPVHYSHNYLTIMPLEAIPLELEFCQPNSATKALLRFDGWNIMELMVQLN